MMFRGSNRFTLYFAAFACTATILAACGGGAAQQGPLDPAGVELAPYGLSESPCGSDLHLATVISAERVYNAFCADDEGRISVAGVAQVGVETEANATSALEHFLILTPDDLPVPEAMERAAETPSGRSLTKEIVKYIHPDAERIDASLGVSTSFVDSCSSASYFEDHHCDPISDWINSGGFLNTAEWCSSGTLTGDAQRTGSAQGVPYPYEGRIRVVACNANVLVRRYYKNPLNGDWWNAGNSTLQPGYALSWIIYASNAHWCPGGLDPCQYASDLRFRVEPSAGASFRYTGGFINYPPIP